MSDQLSGSSFVTAKMIFVIAFILVHMAAVSQVYWLARDILNGDGSCGNLTVPLRYSPMRVPVRPVTVQHQAEYRLCADFALIYFQSLEPVSMQGMYALDSTVDLWGRPSRYSPLMHVICAKTLCRLPYGQACLVHLGFQYLVFISSFIFIFFALRIQKHVLLGILITNICLFLTPVGLSFLERGQYTLYVGLCYLWLMLALVTGKYRYVAVSALFGFLKWTSVPFVFVVFAVGILGCGDTASFRRYTLMAVVYLITLAGLLLLVPDYVNDFLKGLFFQELELVPMGNSLVSIVPRYVVKSVPFLLVGAGLVCRYIGRRPSLYLLPFFAGAATLLVTYPTMAFDYCVPYLAAFIPFLEYWRVLPGIGVVAGMSIQWGYILFLLLASYAHLFYSGSAIPVILIYMAAALLLVATPFLFSPGQVEKLK